jgi:hypothetical protein
LDKAAAPSRGITRSFGSYTVDHGLTGAVCTELKLGCVDGGPRTETRNHPSSSLCSGSQPFASTPVTSDVAIGGLDGNFSGRMSKSFLTFFFVYDSNLCVKRHEAGTTDVVHVSTQTHSYCLDTDESVFRRRSKSHLFLTTTIAPSAVATGYRKEPGRKRDSR